MYAPRHPAYAERYQRTKRRLGKQRGAKVAQVDLARRLAQRDLAHAFPQEKFAPQAPRFVGRPSSGLARANIQFRLILPTRRP